MRQENSLGLLVRSLIAIPFSAVSAWLRFLKSLPQREKELTQASHGAVIMVVAGVLLYQLRQHYIPVPYEVDAAWVFWAFVALGIWGAIWFFVGAARSRTASRDGDLISRAAAKIVIGIIAYLWRNKLPDVPLIGPFEPFLMIGLAYWCLITGLVRLGLLMRPPPPIPVIHPNVAPYGTAGFDDGLSS